MRLLIYCGTLAAGEFLASLCPEYSPLWPALAVVAAFVALFGYGLGARGWTFAFVFVLGLMLFFQSELSDKGRYRNSPWLRGRARRQSAQSETVLRVRGDLAQRMSVGLDARDEAVPLCRAILLGERRRMSPRLKRLFVDSGAIHVFAISGLHVRAVANVLATVLAFFAWPRRYVSVLSVPLLWGYVWVIDFPPSAVRAALMATFDGLAPVVWRRPNGLRSWALTFLLVHLVRPLQIVHVGSALSFAVMLAIVLTGDRVRNLARWKQTLLVTFAAWAVGVPIAAHVFGRVTPGGILSNLLLLETAKLAVYAGVAGAMASFASETLAAHFNNLCALVIRAMTLVAEAVSSLPGASVETGSWPIPLCAVWYSAWLLCGLLAVRAFGRKML